jgi:PAS domain S-box-containing protein
MASHPGGRERHVPEEVPAAWDPIRRALEENEDWYRDLVEHSQDLLCVHDLEGRFLSVNPVPARLLGYTVQEALRMRLQDVIDPQFHAEFDAYLREIERTGESRGLMAVVTRSGEQRIWEYHNTLRTEGVESPIVRGIAHDVTERVRAEKALRATNEQLLKTARERERILHDLTLFRTLLDQSNDAILVTDPETLRFLDSNERAWAELGYSREELLSMTVFDIDPDIVTVRTRVDQQLRQTGCAIVERAHRRKDGTTFPVELNLHRVRLDREYDVAVSRDITERKRAERALRSLSACNESLVRATDEPGLLRQICDLVVNVGGYRMACVGYAEHDERRTVRVVAASGFEAGYLDTLNVTWADEKRGRGPTGAAIRTGEVTACRDMTSDPRFAPWREDAIKRGYRSSLALPLKSGEEVLGALTIYATETGVFDAAEQRLLEELSNNLSYGIMALRARAERKQAEETLHESERRYRLLFSEMVVGFALIEPIYDENGKPCDYRYLEVNPAFETHSGLPRNRVLGKTLREVLPTLDPFWFETYGKVATTGESIHFENYAPPLEKWLELVAFRTHQGQVVVTFADITKRKRAEEALRESEARERTRAKELETVLEAVPVPVFIAYDAECLRMTGNRAAYEQARVPAGENISQSAPPEERPTCRLMQDGVEVPTDLLPMQQAATTGKPVYGRALTIVFEDGSERETVVNAVPLLDEEGKPRGAVGASIDLTELKQSERALRESELRFRTVYERSPIGIALVDSHTRRFLQANPKFCEIAGRSEEELLELDIGSITHPDDVQRSNEYLQKLAEEKLPNYELEKRYLHQDGSVRWVRILVVPMWGEGETSRWQMGLVKDITERRQAEAALRESERRQQLALQIGKIGAFELDLESGRGTWTAEFAEIWGIPSGFAGDFATFFRWELVHPEDRARVKEEFAQLVQSREEGESEFRVIRPDGVVRWIRGRGLVIRDTASRSSRVAGVIRDITERKRAEEAVATLVQVRADSSENFFTSMACQLAKCLEADYTIIGELIEGEEGKLRTIGVCGQGAIADNFTYDLAHTPCEGVIRQGTCSYVSGVAEIFPKDVLLKQANVEAYAGTPLRDSQGRTVGIMVALYTRPLANPKFVEAILQLFSTRTAAEIERKRTEEALRQSEERFRVALKHSPIAVFSQDRDLRYTWMYNPQLPRPVSEQLGKTAADIFDPEEAARITEVRRRVLETGVGVRDEIQVTFGGREHYFNTTIEPVLDSSGAVIGLTGASMDVTELRVASEALREAKKRLTEEKLYLEQEINTELGFGDIIGQSKALEAVMENVGKVAASDATVLLLGETGTGKELVARAIHWSSQRTGNSFIKLNCAAIPSGLLESELFGNEKGAFTGAVSKKIGRLELADKGTLFLDEIGEISLVLQPKLLRVLQDQEFERLGGTQTLKVDFRLIAATNRDLADAVREKEFRSDLYYRLNVFPIRVPPLRERREDIHLLVEHFVQKFARRMNKSITSIPKKTMDALMGWEWPGNVRELENFIERSVILTQGSVLVSPLSELQPMSTEDKSEDETLEAVEREHILRALRESHGQIGGLKGAAMRLGLKRTTLQSKLKHYGINPRSGPQEH